MVTMPVSDLGIKSHKKTSAKCSAVVKKVKAAVRWEFGGKEERTKQTIIALPPDNPLVQLNYRVQGGIR